MLVDLASPELGMEPSSRFSGGYVCDQAMYLGYTLLPFRKMEKSLMFPRRRLVKVRPTGVLLRGRGFFDEPLAMEESNAADRSMTRTLPLSRDSWRALWVSFLFRGGTRDIILVARMVCWAIDTSA